MTTGNEPLKPSNTSDAEPQQEEIDFSEKTIKAALAGVTRPSLVADAIVEGCRKFNAGFVLWDASPPEDVPWLTHRRSILEAFKTGFAFCQTDTRDEWVLLGAAPLIIVRGLSEFQPAAEPVVCYPLVYIGKLCGAEVFVVVRNSEQYRIGSEEFYMGVFGEKVRVARGVVENSPISFARHEEAGEDPQPVMDDEPLPEDEDEPMPAPRRRRQPAPDDEEW